MIEAVCTGRLIILSAYARTGMHLLNGMLQCRINLSEIIVSNGESDKWRERWSA